MTRVKKGTHALKHRRKVLKMTKGYRFDRSRKERAANEAIKHSAKFSFAHRRDKKNDFRKLWNVRINAALKEVGISYSAFIGLLKKNKIEINRKMLSEIAKSNPESFKRIVDRSQKA